MGNEFYHAEDGTLTGFKIGYGDDASSISLGLIAYEDGREINNIMLVYEESFRKFLFHGGIGSISGEYFPFIAA